MLSAAAAKNQEGMLDVLDQDEMEDQNEDEDEDAGCGCGWDGHPASGC